MKKLFVLILAAFIMIALSVKSFAEVDVKSSGSKVTTAVAVDFYGPAVTKVGGTAIVDSLAITGNQVVTGNLSTTGTFTSSNATTLGWTMVSSANTFGTSMCTNACVFCINGQGTVGDANVGCDVATADKCLCAGAN
jgi:hypothetical protein